jgi:hypothetical protein
MHDLGRASGSELGQLAPHGRGEGLHVAKTRTKKSGVGHWKTILAQLADF